MAMKYCRCNRRSKLKSSMYMQWDCYRGELRNESQVRKHNTQLVVLRKDGSQPGGQRFHVRIDPRFSLVFTWNLHLQTQEDAVLVSAVIWPASVADLTTDIPFIGELYMVSNLVLKKKNRMPRPTQNLSHKHRNCRKSSWRIAMGRGFLFIVFLYFWICLTY